MSTKKARHKDGPLVVECRTRHGTQISSERESRSSVSSRISRLVSRCVAFQRGEQPVFMGTIRQTKEPAMSENEITARFIARRLVEEENASEEIKAERLATIIRLTSVSEAITFIRTAGR